MKSTLGSREDFDDNLFLVEIIITNVSGTIGS